MILPFCQKRKDNIFLKNTLKDEISGIIRRVEIHPRKPGIFS